MHKLCNNLATKCHFFQTPISLALFLLFFLFPSTVFAANHYIRQGGSGDGSDWNNAFGQVPGTLIRGDTYYVADGNYNAFTVDDAISGSNFIHIKKATIDDHGTEQGWQNAYGDGVAVFDGTIYIRTSYVEINGQYEYGFKFMRSNCNGSFDIISSDGTSFNLGTDYVQFKYCEIAGCGEDMGDYGQDAVYIRGNGTGDWAQHWLLHHCYLHDVNVTCILTRFVNNATIEYCTFARRHTNGSKHGELISWNQGGLNQNCIFRYNKMYDCAGTGMLVIKETNADQSGWKIYGNLFYNTSTRYHVSNAVITDTGSPSKPKGDIFDIKVYNNTFVNTYSVSGGLRGPFGSLVGVNGNEFKNNLCYNTGSTSGLQSRSHNLWNDAGQTNQDSGTTGQYWSGGTDLFVDYANHDYRLAQPTEPGDASIGAEYATDMYGNVRGADGVWDRGAFEFTDGGGGATTTVPPEAPSPPTGLQIIAPE